MSVKAIMTDSTVEVLCYLNKTIFWTKTNLRYIGNNVEIESIDMPIHMCRSTFFMMHFHSIGETHF